MKLRITVLILVLILVFSGCGMQETNSRIDQVEESIENRIDSAEEAVENAFANSSYPSSSQNPALTAEQAQAIALEHAGLTADQVEFLRTEFDYDDGQPEYEVDFRQGTWEYDYVIHGNTGAVISFDKDDI